MKKLLLILVFLLCASSLFAAGTVTMTQQNLGANMVRYALAWVSDATGVVSGNAVRIDDGNIVQVKCVPNSAGTQPTNLYDVRLNDATGTDWVDGGALDLSNVTSSIIVFNPRIVYDGVPLDLVIGGAGNAKGGTVYIYVAR